MNLRTDEGLAERNDRLPKLLVTALSLLGLFGIFGTALFQPNAHCYAFAGDALVLYYNFIYHVRYGHGAMLTGMNYPHGEYIFLTDAQGALATVVQWIHQHLLDVSGYELAIIHVFNWALVIVCALVVYQLLRNFKVKQWLAVPFSVLITLMGPQIFRLKVHFGLAYPFLIPLALLWFMRKYNKGGKLEWRDLGFGLLLTFFTFNNPYVGLSAAAPIFIAGGWLLLTKQHRRTGFVAIGVLAAAILVPFLTFHLNDPVADRIVQQDGFFSFRGKLDGLVCAPESLPHQIGRAIGGKMNAGDNRWVYFGATAAGLLLGLLGHGVVRLFRSGENKPKQVLHPTLRLVLFASLGLYLFLVKLPIWDTLRPWMEANMGPLLMFKAAGRLAWSFYTFGCLAAVVYLDFLLRKMRSQQLAVGIATGLCLLWAVEIAVYVRSYFKDIYNSNYLDKQHEDQLLDPLRAANVDLTPYKAMLVVPRMMAWSDYFICHLDFNGQFYSMRLSAATGIPMFNAMLSRISTAQGVEGLQLYSHPVIDRERVAKLPPDLDILMLVAKTSHPFSYGENYLVSLGKRIYEGDTYSLYSLKAADLQRNPTADAVREQYRAGERWHAPLWHRAFDDKRTAASFHGQGALLAKQGDRQLIEKIKVPLPADTSYTFVAWHHYDYLKYGMGGWKVVVKDSLGQSRQEYDPRTREGFDVQAGWLRSEVTFPAPRGGTIQFEFTSNKDIFLDELMLYPKGDTVLVDDADSPYFLWNGYSVSKESQKMDNGN